MIFDRKSRMAMPQHTVADTGLTAEALAAAHKHASHDRIDFWADLARHELCWSTPFTIAHSWEPPFARWFEDGRLNASEQCLDVHLKTGLGRKVAVVWEGEPVDAEGAPTQRRTLTFDELHELVERFAAGLTSRGIGKGDRVVVYMPLVPEVLVAMLACARIGATHSVVFAGFSAESLRDRVLDAGAKAIVTADGGFRRGKVVPLHENVRKVRAQIPAVETVVVLNRVGSSKGGPASSAPLHEGEVGFHELLGTARAAAVPVGAEHPLFILYTSGTTGKPKGVVHSTAGYLLWAKKSMAWVFDPRPEDVFWCTADVGWITGHTYVCYGPLANGTTVFLYEGAPDFPNGGRFWDIIEREKITVFYTAPTAIRSFMRQGNTLPDSRNLASLRLLGSVGEPINPEAWHWYADVIGKDRCPLVDTWWQTETGGIMMTVLPAMGSAKPGCATRPLPGIEVDVVSDDGTSVPKGADGKLVVKSSWPSQLRTVHGDPTRYANTYWGTFSGPGGTSKEPWYFTGDGAHRDEDGDIWITGRVDDVMNVAGHRLGTMEVESALVGHSDVAEAAVVGVPDAIKGTSVFAFVTLMKASKARAEDESQRIRLETELRDAVAREIGSFAKPEHFRFTDALPKTRSGKIMRRLLRDVATGHEALGDTSTLEDVSVLSALQHYHED
jgi:acetyl-CoA synthetase